VTGLSSSDGLRSVLISYTKTNCASRSSTRHYRRCDARIREGSSVANSGSACTRCINPTRQYCRVSLHSGRWYMPHATFSSDMDLTVRALVRRCNKRPAFYLLSIECAKLCCRYAAHILRSTSRARFRYRRSGIWSLLCEASIVYADEVMLA
jgi:hypothetical protein